MARNVFVTVGSIPSTNPLIDSGTPGGVQPVGLSGYTLAFSDEFNGSTLNALKWDTHYPDTWPGFTSQSPGGYRTNTGGADACQDDHVALNGTGSVILTNEKLVTITGLPYTSGTITSLKSYTADYGVYEARMRTSGYATGFWPAFWMSSSAYDSWNAEFDIFEEFGAGTYENNVYRAGSGWFNSGDMANTNTAWHTYSVRWTSGGVWFYRDGAQTATATAPTKQSMYILFDTATQASMSPSYTGPYTLEVDYVRAWV